MELSYDLYAFQGESLEALRERVEEALGLRLEERESGYRGGIYYLARPIEGAAEKITVQRNYLEMIEDYAQPKHADQPYLLYVDGTRRAEELRRSLEGIEGLTLIRSERA